MYLELIRLSEKQAMFMMDQHLLQTWLFSNLKDMLFVLEMICFILFYFE
jgi:hypothetical protein